MKLINTDGMAFIGPGSEWFWTAVSGIVLAVTFLAIYRQLRLQRSLAAVEQIDAVMRDFFSERMLRYRLDVLVAFEAGGDRAHLPIGSTTAIANYFEKLGTLAHQGHIDLHLLSEMAFIGQAWWAILEPHIRRTWAEMGLSAQQSEFEWLVEQFAEVGRRAHATTVFDDAYLRDSLEADLAFIRELLQVEQSLRTVMIASPEMAQAAPPATPVAVEA